MQSIQTAQVLHLRYKILADVEACGMDQFAGSIAFVKMISPSISPKCGFEGLYQRLYDSFAVSVGGRFPGRNAVFVPLGRERGQRLNGCVPCLRLWGSMNLQPELRLGFQRNVSAPLAVGEGNSEGEHTSSKLRATWLRQRFRELMKIALRRRRGPQSP